MTRLLLLALGAILGYTARQPPLCERTHLPRHLDPAIVDRESDEGVLPPDPRTWTERGSATLTTASPVNVTITPTVTTGPRWPDALAHEGAFSVGCPLCEALQWQRRR